MRCFFKTVTVILLSGILACPVMEARGRNNNSNTGGSSTPTATQQAPARPGASGNAPVQTQRPANNGTPQRPGNNGYGGNAAPSQTQRPANNGTPQRPGNGNGAPNHYPAHQPGPAGPGHNFAGPGPQHGHQPGPGMPPPGVPHMPHMPAPRPFSRPVPPPTFRPYAGVPVISTILGVALGTALNLSINALVNSGHTVIGYGNDAIYLNNAYQLNMLWPNATMYYSNGMLAASDFVYSTPYYDTARYNMAYNSLVRSYGMPVTSQMLYNGGMEATWFGYNGQYVRLQYTPQTAYNGSVRYYTTLSFGV